jgi:hypothetical protein
LARTDRGFRGRDIFSLGNIQAQGTWRWGPQSSSTFFSMLSMKLSMAGIDFNNACKDLPKLSFSSLRRFSPDSQR